MTRVTCAQLEGEIAYLRSQVIDLQSRDLATTALVDTHGRKLMDLLERTSISENRLVKVAKRLDARVSPQPTLEDTFNQVL